MIEKIKQLYDYVPLKKSSKAVTLWLFKKLNIEYQQEDINDDNTTYNFSFQDANFHIICSNKGHEIVVNFYYIFCEKYDYRQAIYYLCNCLNRDYHQANFFYSYDEETNEISVHLKNTSRLDEENKENKERFTNILGDFFALRRLFHDEFVNIKSTVDKSKEVDVIDELHKEKRGKYLVYEQEIANKHFTAIRTNFQHLVLTPCDIFTISGKFLPADNIKKISFTHIHHSIQEIPIEEYTSFNIASTIRDIIENKNPNDDKEDKYQISISCLDGDYYTASLIWQSESKNSDYFLLTIQNSFLLKKNGMREESDQPLNMIYVLDKSKSNNIAEAKFMIDDAIDKAHAGKFDELTDEQLVLINFIGWSMSEDLYWGNKYFNDKCYFQAIKHFECVLNSIHPLFDTLNKKQKTEILEVYTKLGFSYTELKVYSKALFYLDVPFGYGHINGCIAYINCLVNSNDFRALDAIDNQLNLITRRLQEYEDDENLPENYVRYRNFLIRRRSFILIEKKLYDQAEEMLTRMLESEDETIQQFAESELAYLKSIKEKGNNNPTKE
ncbi:MAG: hypothetical protein MJZ34_14255 [Paludibacteraceae bacterium]|nr:hypothetical protein [Paludibacteraceae bacterium]